mgnify:CR=1 FL=1|tara:strand:+ start:1529 stop:1726 length:198 start_codon:yes stop_codon:yes gene_type:complete
MKLSKIHKPNEAPIYTVKLQNGEEIDFRAHDMLDFINQLEFYKSSKCVYLDEIADIEISVLGVYS